MKNLIIFSIIILAFAAESCTDSSGKSPRIVNTEKIPVRIMKLEKTSIADAVRASGQFTTDDETFLAFKTGGIVDRVLVKEGDRIKKGQILASLKMTEIDAIVSQTKHAYEKAKRDHERVGNLYRDSVATLEQLQNAGTALELATQQRDAAEFNKNYSQIRALTDGYILRKMVNAGQMVEPGMPIFQTNGAGKDSWKIRLGVSDKDWARIQIGDSATVLSDASAEELNGLVSRKAVGTDLNTGTFVVEVTLIGQVKTPLASGMFGKVSINPSQKTSGWSIPYDALLDGNMQSGYVFVTNDLATAIKTPVKIHSISKDHVIISEGLENAQALIISGGAYLRDQSTINIIK